MDDVEAFALEHLTEVAVPGRDAIANGKLFGEQRLAVADGGKLGPWKVFHYFGVAVGDLSAADDPDTQTLQSRHLFRVQNPMVARE